jgi:hypothetical protein
MLTYLRKRLLAIFWDEEQGKLFLGVISRSVMMWLGTASGIVIASATNGDGFNFAMTMTWGLRDWGIRLGAAALVSFAMLIRGGDRNRTPEQLVEQLKVAGYRLEKAPEAKS